MIKIKLAEQPLSYYWNITKLPIIILVVWGILAYIVAKFSIFWYKSIFAGLPGIAFSVAVFAFIGHVIIAEHDGKIKNSIWAGAFAGIIVSFIGAVLSIILMPLFPELIQDAVAQAVASGAQEETIRTMMNIMLYVGLITGPIFGGIIGAIASGISGAITKKFGKR